MAAAPPSDDLLSTDVPGMAGAPADGAPGESAFKSRFRQKKLLVVLGAAALGGMLFGVAAMTLIAYLQPAAKAPPTIVAPARDPRQEALDRELDSELKKLKAKNEQLEEQLKLLSQPAPVSAPAPVSLPAPAPVAEPVPVPGPATRYSRSSGAKTKERVTADCTVPDKDEKLGEKLKSCIEGFNASTN